MIPFRACGWGLALVFATAASLAAQAPSLTAPVTVDTVANGLTVIVHEDQSVPVAAVNIWYHVGSGDEKAGRTGFAHLFEHLMFMGSEYAEYPTFDRMLEAAGANNNGSTTEDRTNYYEWGPSNALALMLWLEADRMGGLLPVMTGGKVDLRRDVVKNERRQSSENQPYGLATETILALLYPAGHPYSWPVIGSMTDLSAASLGDVQDFFRSHYVPNNATLVVAGAVKTSEVLRLAGEYFGHIPRGPALPRATAEAARLARDTSGVLEERVQAARLYYVWPTVKDQADDAAALNLLAYLLSGEKNSRLTQAMAYEDQSASGVFAFQDGKRLAGDFWIVATARPGKGLPELQGTLAPELNRLTNDGPTARELDQAKNSTEANLLRQLETVNEKADQLNSYFVRTGTADGFAAELSRYRAVTAADIQRVAKRYLQAPRVMLSVVPQGHPELAATPTQVTP
ncbi:MAG: pitrilysin family protein [Gemmatimonadota bacterium]|nr:pitrilysin family protein [Gemmatimonadota bacterium]